MTIGILSALSTAAGTTTALFGLLFAMIGGSLLTWLDPSKVEAAKLPLLSLYSARLSVGLICGLIIGFALRWVDQRYIQPDIIERRLQAESTSLSGPLDRLEATARRLDSQVRPASDKVSASTSTSGLTELGADDLKKLAGSLEQLSKKLKEIGEPNQTGVLILHADRQNALAELSKSLYRDTHDPAQKSPEPQAIKELHGFIDLYSKLNAAKDLRMAYPGLKDDTIDLLGRLVK